MDLKNKLTEEEAKEFARILIPRLICKTCVDGDEECISCIVETIKQSGIIRKNAEKETDQVTEKILYLEQDGTYLIILKD